MARADLLCDLIKYGLTNDTMNFKRAAEAICAEEYSKQHKVLGKKIEDLLKTTKPGIKEVNGPVIINNGTNEQNLIWEKYPQKRISELLLPKNVLESCNEIIEEQMRVDILRSYGIEPRNKILLVGPPGNGKTSLAEAIAESLSVPLLTVRYESIIGSYLGETATKLSKLIEYAKSRQCVLFFDEFETLGKERGDMHETGEIKRVVSSLLLHIDSLPSYVVVIGATNHEGLLDKAAWRRFQVKLFLPKPEQNDLEKWYTMFEKKKNFKFGISPLNLAKRSLGLSFAECEELGLSIYRQYILNLPNANNKKITEKELELWDTQIKKPEISNLEVSE
ncbi:ATP-binding protein [Acetobacterium sp. K1/6]|jgi:ATPases of the AAA+ class|nr:ATP-binding protein [Acetobacterium sp. K1/6]MDZ5723421.1 ATP-binding protein [Acetobacterium sp. K1/6]